MQAQNDKKPIVTPKRVHDCYKKQTRLKEDQYLLQKPSKRTRRNTRRSTSPKRTYAEFSDDDLSDISASLSDVSEDADWNSEEEEQPPKKRAKKNDPTMGGDWGITENPKVKAKASKKEVPESDSEEDLISESNVDVSMGEASSHAEDSESDATEEMDTETIAKEMASAKPIESDSSEDNISDAVVVKGPGKHGNKNLCHNETCLTFFRSA